MVAGFPVKPTTNDHLVVIKCTIAPDGYCAFCTMRRGRVSTTITYEVYWGANFVYILLHPDYGNLHFPPGVCLSLGNTR